MCGRFTLTRKDFRMLVAELGIEGDLDEAYEQLYRPRYNIAPTDQHWIVRTKYERREMLPAKWGLINSWSKDAKGAARHINAKSETAAKSPAFKEAFEKRRCVVPADGFFEWRGAKEARQPIWFHPPDDALLLFAGLYESWREPQSGEWWRTFTILTTGASDDVAAVHDRMPVILPPDRIDEWMYPKAGERDVRGLLVPAPAGTLAGTPVSRRVNSVANDDADCLQPANDAEPVESPRLL